MQSGPLWPLVVYFVAVLFLVGAMLGLSYVLGQRHMQPQTGQPYEAGIVATGAARRRFDVKYYLVAMFFVIFDLEAAFIFAWAVAARELGWPGYIAVVVFIALLAAALAYLWRLGALDWKTPRQRGQRLR
jgi:NADH-quinone oxidoreductase subunit A